MSMEDNQDMDSETENSLATNDNDEMAEKEVDETECSRRSKCKKCHNFMYTIENIRSITQKKRTTYLHSCTKKQCRSFKECPTKWRQQHPEVIEQEKAEKKKRKEAEKENSKERANQTKKAKLKEKRKSNIEEMNKKFEEIKNIQGLEKVNNDPNKFVGAMNIVKDMLLMTNEPVIALPQQNTNITTKPQELKPTFSSPLEEENYYRTKYEEAQTRRLKTAACIEHYADIVAYMDERNIDAQTFLDHFCALKQKQNTDSTSSNSTVNASK